MSTSFSADGSVRCWICMKNGENRFFNGHAARKVHEETVHAPRYSLGNIVNTDASFQSQDKQYVSTNDREYSSQNATPLTAPIACYKQLEYTKRRLRFQNQRTSSEGPECYSLANFDQWLENGADLREYEIKSLNVRIKQAMVEIDARNATVKKLQADLDRFQTRLSESQVKEAQLQQELEAAKGQLRNATNELNQALGAIQHERDQRMQMQQILESRLNSQKMQIVKLREELDSEKLMTKQREIDCDEVIQIKRKNKQIEKELVVEKRLKLEEKLSKEECQAEIDELVEENSDIKKKLTRYRHDLERLQDENRSLIADYNSMMDRGDVREAEQQIALLQQLMEERLGEERVDFAREIERYQQDCEEFKIRFEQTAAELEKTRSELEGAVLYRQDDIDRLLQEKQNLKLELKAKKTKLKSLEATNEELKSQINEKERQLARQHATKSKDDNKPETERQLYEKCKEIGRLQNKVVELETSLTSKNTQFKGENTKLKEALKQLQMAQVELTRSQSDEDQTIQNEELRRNLHQAQKYLLEDQKRVQEVITSFEEQKEAFLSTFEEEKADLTEKLDKVLEANVDFEKNCIQLETTLEEKETKITALQQALKDVEAQNKDILSEENKAVKNSLATSQKEVNILKEQVARLEGNLDVKQQEATSHLKNFKKEIQALDEEKITAKSQVSELMSKIEQINADFYAKEEKFQTEIRMITVQLQQAKEQDKSLLDANTALKTQIANQIDIEADLEKRIQNLTEANRELETAKSTIVKLGGIIKGLESSCADLKAELQSKEEEIKQSGAKQDDLFNEIKEREKLCGGLEAKLLKVEEQLKGSIKNAEQEKILNQNSLAEDKGQSELKIAELTKTKELLEIQDKMMKEQIANIEKQKMSQERDACEKEKKLLGKIQELSKTNEEVLKREKQVVMQNHEMKKTLDANNLVQKSLEDEVKSLSSKLESKEQEQAATTSAMGALHKEIEDWQRKFDDLASTLADTEANIQVLAQKSAGNEKELKAQNRALKQEIEAAKSDLEVKNTELVLMAKKVDNGELLSKTICEKSAEIKAKVRYIEELDQENRKLIAETKKFERVVNELQDKVEKLEFEYDGCKQEKEIYEKELEKQKVNNHHLKNTAKDLGKAREDIQELAVKNKELLLKCEQLQAKLDQGKQPEPIQNTSSEESLGNKEDSSYEYESDFEEESECSGESETELTPRSEKEDANDKIKQTEKDWQVDNANFDDDDDFWNSTFDRTPQTATEDASKPRDKRENDNRNSMADEIMEVGENKNAAEDSNDEVQPYSKQFIKKEIGRKMEGKTVKALEQNVFEDEEDDMLSSFVAKQKKNKSKSSLKKTKNVTKKEQMTKDLGFDLEIDDLISDIEMNNEDQGNIEIKEPKIMSTSSQRDPGKISETGMKVSNGVSFGPFLSTSKALGRNMLLPQLGPKPQSLPPLRSVKRPNF